MLLATVGGGELRFGGSAGLSYLPRHFLCTNPWQLQLDICTDINDRQIVHCNPSTHRLFQHLDTHAPANEQPLDIRQPHFLRPTGNSERRGSLRTEEDGEVDGDTRCVGGRDC